MKKEKLFGILLLFLGTISFVSCDDDEIKDPDDTVTLNMLNEENGKTLLGTSDVYINKSNNFKTSSCYIADVGEMSGLGVNVQPQINNLAQEVAVVPGHLYQIYDEKVVRDFPSGTRAILIETGYYKAYVVAPITYESITAGASVKYILTYPEAKGLPEYNELIGNVNQVGDRIEYALSKDSEYVFGDYLNDDRDAFDIQIANEKLTVTLLKSINKISGPYGTYGMYLRSGSTFTYIKFNAGMKE